MARTRLRLLERGDMNYRSSDRISDSHNRSVHDIGGPNPTDVRTDVTDEESSYVQDLSYVSNAREIGPDLTNFGGSREPDCSASGDGVVASLLLQQHTTDAPGDFS